MIIKQDPNFWPTLVVLEGVPYLLEKQDDAAINDVCSLCDLKDECTSGDHRYKFVDLCSSDLRGEEWFFKKDWDVLDMQIRDLFAIEIAYEERDFTKDESK